MNSPQFDAVRQVNEWLQGRIIGQEALLERLMIALLVGGHLLVEGAPGLAKTRAVKELSRAVEGDFHRIQFTPDLLPSDVTGTEIYRPEDGSFKFQHGPIFHNLLLADEINRAPAKVQSALLEAMAEHQVSIGRVTYPLPPLFLVMATQNPIEQEGTYPLPEAQLDRFLLHVTVDYPAAADEHRILNLVRSESLAAAAPAGDTPANRSDSPPPARLDQATIFAARKHIWQLHMAEPVQEYIVQLVMASRKPQGELADWIEYGASPRGTIAIDASARALAWLDARDYVTPEDVQAVAHDALRHRILTSFNAEAQGISVSRIIDRLLATVPAP